MSGPPHTWIAMKTNRVTYAKAETALSALSTYLVHLDGEAVGTVSRVRHEYLRRLGGHRGNNVHAARTDWIVTSSGVHYDTRAEATIALLAETTGMSYGAALDIVRGKVRNEDRSEGQSG